MNRRFVVVALSCWLFLPLVAVAADGSQSLAVTMRSLVDAGRLAGSVTLVAQDGKILNIDCVGQADVGEALQLIVTRARDLLRTDLAWMGLVNQESGTLDMRVAVGATTEPFMRMRLELGDGVGGAVVANRAPVVVKDYARDRPPTPAWISDAILGEGIGSMLCCPMLTGEKVVGGGTVARQCHGVGTHPRQLFDQKVVKLARHVRPSYEALWISTRLGEFRCYRRG